MEVNGGQMKSINVYGGQWRLMEVKRAIGKVGGIKIESAAGRQKKTRAAMEFPEKRKFFTLWPPARKRKEISGWVQWVT